MHRSRAQPRPVVLSLLLGTALLLRVLVPAGYMPASLADGWMLQLCPDGLPAAAAEALLGSTHRHHHHAGPTTAAPEGTADVVMPQQCELGAGFAAAAVAEAPAPAASEPGGRRLAPTAVPRAPLLRERFEPHPRGPPGLLG